MKNTAPWVLVLAAILAVSPLARLKSEDKQAQAVENEKTETPKAEDREKGSSKVEKDAPKAEAEKDAAEQADEKKENCQLEKGKTVPPQPWCEPLRVLHDFFGIKSEKKWLRDDSLEQVRKAVGKTHYELQFMVALVADPFESQLPLNFDLALDGIQKGFAESNYRFDRFWLPWTGEDAREERLYRTAPGILLFRKPDKSLMIVFLVGESPKSGIHKLAFQLALGLIEGIQDTADPSATKLTSVSILGPSFSGSVDSLLSSLADLNPKVGPPHRPLFVHIATGTATAADLEGRFQGWSFCRTVVPDNVLQQMSFEFLAKKMGWDLGKAALLTEADTAYGQDIPKTFNLVRIGFPSQISDVRNAWEQGGDERKEISNVPIGESQLRPRRPALDLSLRDREGEPVEVMPNFSSLTTPSRDLELSNVLEAISREGIHYIGVLSTDLKDRLFLIDKIRTLAPDTIIFTFDNHLLLGHPDYGDVMDGVIVLTSAPLFTEGIGWLPQSVSGGNQRRQFTAESQQGIFEAVRYFLDSPHQSRPQVWVTAVGNGSHWPIAHLNPEIRPTDPYCRSSSTPQPTENLPKRREDLAGKTNLQMLFFGGVLCLLSALLGRLGFLKVDGATRYYRIGEPLVLIGRILLAMAGAVLLIVASIPEWAYFLQPNLWEHSLPPAWPRVLLLVSLGLVCFYLSFQVVHEPGAKLALKGWIAWFLVTLVALCLLLWLLLELWMPRLEISFFQLRARAFSSGLSPLVSLALLLSGAMLWIFCELRRQWLLERQSVDCPLEMLCEKSTAGCGRTLEQIGIWLRSSLPPNGWLWLLLSGTFIPPFILLWVIIQPITETRQYGWVFIGFLAVVGFLAKLSFCRFVVLWIGLRRILYRLDHASSALTKTFEGLAGEIDWKPMRAFGFRTPPFKMLLLSVKKLAVILESKWIETVTPDELWNSLEGIFESEGQYPGKELKNRRKLERTLGEACKALKSHARLPATREFLAVRVVAYLRYVFAHLRNCLISSIGTGLILLMAVSAYAFEPKQYVSLAIWVWLTAAIGITLWFFLEMDRNPTLSRIGGTKVGEVTWDRTFFTNIFLYIGVPVLGVITTQFPQVGRLLGHLANQLLQVAGGG